MRMNIAKIISTPSINSAKDFASFLSALNKGPIFHNGTDHGERGRETHRFSPKPGRAHKVEDQTLLCLLVDLHANPEQSDFGTPEQNALAYERELAVHAAGEICRRLEWVPTDVRARLDKERGPLTWRPMPPALSWRKAWSPGVILIGRNGDFPEIFGV
jgi:hypothetical protein